MDTNRLGRYSARFSLCFLLVVLSACTLINPPDRSAQEVVKSASDARQYRYLELPNHLKVLLISDPNTDKSAASMDVHVGSAADPQQLLGLAHFLEHMLFLGTKKYPEADAYQEFISSHGGNHNAYTSFEDTNYFFDIDPDQLEPALDRFSQFFIAPLFTEQYVEREKNAVHSEFMAKIKNDQRRSLDVFKSIVNPEHPFSKFSVGNLDTLSADGSDKVLREQLIAFYRQHYSSNIMTLVVLGKQPIDQLETMVKKPFAAIPDRHVSTPTIDQPLFAAGNHGLPLYLQVQPEKKQRSLSVAFPVAEAWSYYREKPLYYIGNILGHEGTGSLLSWLKGQGWAEGLSAGTGLSYRGGATFDVSVKLTREGIAHVDEIVKALFQTVNRIRQTPNQQWLFDEQKQLAEQSFRFQGQAAPIDYVLSLSSGMQLYAPEDILQGPYRMDQFDWPLIERFLDEMVPENAIVTLTAPEAEVDQRTALYQTPFSLEKVSAERLAHWRGDGDMLNSAIQLPEPNPFIARDLTLKFPSLSPEERAIADSGHPKLIQNRPGFKLWYKPDQQFQLPKGTLLVGLQSPLAFESGRNQALLRLFASLVSDQLNEQSYPAALAGLGFSVSAEAQGLLLKIHGYTDKQPLLLDMILETMSRAEFDEQRFENLRREQVRALQNKARENPYMRTFDAIGELLQRQRFSDQALLAAYGELSLDDLQRFHDQLFADNSLQVLVNGNYSSAEAQQMGERLRQALGGQAANRPAEEVARLDERVYTLPVESHYSDAAVMLYLQGDNLDKSTRAALGLTSQILRSGFYTELRTEKQLGYIVTSGAYPVRDVPGLFFLVQSPVAGAATLQREIEQYLQRQLQQVQAIDQETFDRQRAALILRLSEEPKNLWEQSADFWKQIDQHYWHFDFKSQLIASINALTLEGWQQQFAAQMQQLQRALWIYAPGKFADDSKLSGRPVGNLDQFRQQLRYYHFP